MLHDRVHIIEPQEAGFVLVWILSGSSGRLEWWLPSETAATCAGQLGRGSGQMRLLGRLVPSTELAELHAAPPISRRLRSPWPKYGTCRAIGGTWRSPTPSALWTKPWGGCSAIMARCGESRAAEMGSAMAIRLHEHERRRLQACRIAPSPAPPHALLPPMGPSSTRLWSLAAGSEDTQLPRMPFSAAGRT